jgi:hypothetical protein
LVTAARSKQFVYGTEYSVLSTQYSIQPSRFFARLALTLAVLAEFCSGAPCFAQSPAEHDPIAETKDALARGNRFPWYDRKNDDIRRLNVVPRQAEADRDVQWTASPTTAPTAAPRAAPKLGAVGSFLQWIGLTALILLLGLIAYLIATSFLKDEVTETTSVRKVVESRRDADRVQALPFQVRAATSDFLAEAGRLYQAGQYSEAIVYLFSHQLVELDKAHCIRLAKGKTNRQYLHETRSRPLIHSILDATMVAFEDAFFGNKKLSRETFERCWNRLNEFELEVERQEQLAA